MRGYDKLGGVADRRAMGFGKRFNLSLRRRIFVVVLLLAFVPSLVMLFAATGYGVAAIRSFAVEQSQNRLFTQAERIGDFFIAEMAALRSLASAPNGRALMEGGIPRGRLRELLSDRKAAVLTPGGGVRELMIGGLLPGAGALPEQLVERLSEIPRPAQGDPIQTIPGVEPGEVWGIAPLEGRPGYAVARQLRSAELEATLSLANRPDPDRVIVVARPGSPVGFRDDNGELDRLLSEHPEVLRVPRGVFSIEGQDNVVYTSVRVSLLPTATGVRGEEPAFVLIQRVNLETPLLALLVRFWQLVIVGLVFLLGVALFGVWISKRMVDPILQLRAGFQRLEQGDLESRVIIHTGDELEELARSMNRMAGTLQKTYENLANKLLELDEKASQLSVTYEISQTINQSLEMDTLFRDIIASVRRMVVSQRLLLVLFGEGTEKIERVYRWPLTEGFAEGVTRLGLRGTVVDQAFRERRVLVVSTTEEATGHTVALFTELQANALCIVPLIGASGRIGVLILADPESTAFGDQEIDLLELLSPNLAMAVEHSRLYARQAEFAVELESRVQQRTQELQRAQEQLLQVEKFAAAGELAANIAHEINNPLSIIKNYMKLLDNSLIERRVEPQDVETAREGLEIIGEEIDRIARIVEQLRRVSMPQSPDLAPVVVNEQLGLMVELFRHTFQRKKISLETQFDPGLGTMMLSSDYLRQIMINLLRNAYDAVPVGGQIVVESKADFPDAAHYTIVVRDNGTGIPAEHLTKIFDPFFTTKKEGKGTGLGLSVSFGLARQMSGRIEAFSEPGKMTEMRVILPRHRPDPEGEEHEVVRRQGGRIIIG